MFSETAKASKNQQPGRVECSAVRSGEWVQMEGPAQRIRRLARDLCPGEPLGEKGRSSSGVSAFTAIGNHSNKSECGKLGLHLHQGTSRRNGRFEKNGPQSIGRTRGGWNTKLHMVAASDRDGVTFSLSAGNCGDGPEGRALLQKLGPIDHPLYLLMDRAYEGDETRALAVKLGYIPVVPPKSNRKNPWSYDKQLYKQRNQVERLFRRIKRFRRIFTRYDKLDTIFLAFIYFALIVDALM